MRSSLVRAASFAVGAIFGTTVAFGGAARADHPGAGGRPFDVALSGANEVPSNPHGDADRGTAALTLNPGQEEVCFSFGPLSLSPGEPLPFAAHIHEAPPGEPGPVVVDLFGRGDAPTSYPTAQRCVPADRQVILEIIRNPERYYVNLHNATHPRGVVRAQLG